jgi:uroporphyrinogen-III synthase
MPLRLLVTRPEPDAERTAAALRARGHDVLVMPMLRVERIDADFGAGPWAAVLMTSTNAVRAIAGHRGFEALCALPTLVVGERTRAAAEAAGFANVASANGDAEALAGLVVARLSPGPTPLLYLAGEQRTAGFEVALRSHSFDVRTVAIYRTVAATEFSQAIKDALASGEIDGIMHFSRRSAEAFVAAAEATGALGNALTARHYCLSAQVATALANKAVGIEVAAHPSEAALLALVGWC